MRQDPGFDVNEVQDGNGWTLLHHACDESDIRSAVIPLLLAHPGINVNVKDIFGQTPFYCACRYGLTSYVREMLKDSRVKVNEPSKNGWTPLRFAAYYGRLDVIKWWIASGREMDLGTSGDLDTTARRPSRIWPRDSGDLPMEPIPASPANHPCAGHH